MKSVNITLLLWSSSWGNARTDSGDLLIQSSQCEFSCALSKFPQIGDILAFCGSCFDDNVNRELDGANFDREIGFLFSLDWGWISSGKITPFFREGSGCFCDEVELEFHAYWRTMEFLSNIFYFLSPIFPLCAFFF